MNCYPKLVLFYLLLLHALPAEAQQCIPEFSPIRDNPVMMDDGSILWASAEGVLLQHDLGVDRIHFHHDGNPLTGRVVSLFRLDTNLLIYFEDHGLLHVTPNSQKLLGKSDYVDQAPVGPEINAYYPIGDTILLGSTSGISLYDMKLREVVHHIKPATATGLPENPQGRSNSIQAFHADNTESGKIWVMGNSGLFHLNLFSFELTYIPFDIELMKANRLYNPGYISMLLSDAEQYDDELFFSSWAGGVISYHIKENQWNMFLYDDRPDINPMVFNIVSNIVTWDDSLLLCARFDQAPCFFNVHLKTFVSFNDVTGIQPIDEQSRGLLRSGNDFFIGYKKSICRYTGNGFYTRDKPIPGIRLGSMHSYSTLLTGHNGFEVILPTALESFQRTIDFSMQMTGTRNADSISIQCRLSGTEDDWRPLPASGDITYANLSGGEHIFMARILLSDGREIKSKPYAFVIKKYFWEELWFYLLVLFCLSIIILPLLFHLQKMRRARMQANLNHQLELSDTRLAALRAQMNPHFLFNSLSAINHHIVQSDPRTASKYLTKFAHLMRRILNNSQEGFITLENELATIRLYVDMENFRYDHDIEFFENIDNRVDPGKTYIPSMLLQPYVENAIIHGIRNKNASGKIEINISLTNNEPKRVRIAITDNGVGRKKAMELKGKKIVKNKSLGLELTRSRIELLNRRYGIEAHLQIIDKLDEQGQASGTQIQLVLPYLSEKDIQNYG